MHAYMAALALALTVRVARPHAYAAGRHALMMGVRLVSGAVSQLSAGPAVATGDGRLRCCCAIGCPRRAGGHPALRIIVAFVDHDHDHDPAAPACATTIARAATLPPRPASRAACAAAAAVPAATGDDGGQRGCRPARAPALRSTTAIYYSLSMGVGPYGVITTGWFFVLVKAVVLGRVREQRARWSVPWKGGEALREGTTDNR